MSTRESAEVLAHRIVYELCSGGMPMHQAENAVDLISSLIDSKLEALRKEMALAISPESQR